MCKYSPKFLPPVPPRQRDGLCFQRFIAKTQQVVSRLIFPSESLACFVDLESEWNRITVPSINGTESQSHPLITDFSEGSRAQSPRDKGGRLSSQPAGVAGAPRFLQSHLCSPLAHPAPGRMASSSCTHSLFRAFAHAILSGRCAGLQTPQRAGSYPGAGGVAGRVLPFNNASTETFLDNPRKNCPLCYFLS